MEEKNFFENIKSSDKKARLEAISNLSSIKEDKIIYKLIDHLADSYWPIRELSAKKLLTLGDGILEYLEDCIESDNSDIKFWTGWILGKLKSEKSIKMLINSFDKSEDSSTNKNIMKSIIEAGDISLKPLIEGCHSDSIPIRMWCALTLGKFKNNESRETLEKLLNDPSWAVRKNSIISLGELKDKRSLELLINGLNDESWNVRKAATEALGKYKSTLTDSEEMGENEKNDGEVLSIIISKMKNALEDEDDAVREAGISVLGNMGIETAIDPLIKIYDNAKSDNLKKLVIHSISKIDDEKVWKFFNDKLKESDESDLRKEILKTFLNNHEVLEVSQLEKSLYSSDANEVIIAIDLAAKIDTQEILQLLSPLVSNQDINIRYHLTDRFGDMINADPKPYLYILSEDYEPDIRKGSIRSLVKLMGDEVIPDIIEFLNDESEIVQREAISILTKYADIDALTPLLNIVSKGETKNSVYMAIQALMAIGEAAVPSIIKFLSSDDRDLRFWIIEGMAGHNYKEFSSSLVEIIKNEDDVEILNSALNSLKTMDNNFDGELLKTLAQKDGININLIIEFLGKKINKENLTFLLEFLKSPDQEVRFNVLRAISSFGDFDDETIDSIISLLSDKSWPVRKAASDLLGKLGDSIYHKIEEIFTKKYRNADEVFWGIRTLGKFSKKDSAKLLINEYEKASDSLKIEIVKSLGRIGNKEAHDMLIKLLDSKDKNIRFHASKGLKSVTAPEYKEKLIKAMEDEFENVRYWIAIGLGNYSGNDVKKVLTKALEDESHWVRKYAEDSLKKISNN